ncbi:hypothetical protein LL14B4_12725 [Lactococcus lactis subsp. lactis]|uniref:Uncharacterized protein n=1 Tax=Lactococcus lactis subsp. lactis TaxID=1360 RepID=A0A2Z3KSY4_LACLL|nr:hypothetical protein [Lactococcus lactis]AWN66969.1 hypothetical protein LL14B4_12725 [Lactococcus lactis subsp. lactis]
MKPSEIEAYAYEVIYPDCDGELFFTLYLAKERAAEVGGDIRMLHTSEQMQQYAKECVRASLKILDNAILPIFEDDERVVMQKIFGEDTKND